MLTCVDQNTCRAGLSATGRFDTGTGHTPLKRDRRLAWHQLFEIYRFERRYGVVYYRSHNYWEDYYAMRYGERHFDRDDRHDRRRDRRKERRHRH